jgi:hypothetical protein
MALSFNDKKRKKSAQHRSRGQKKVLALLKDMDRGKVAVKQEKAKAFPGRHGVMMGIMNR